MRTTARGVLALITGLLLTAGLLTATTAPASAGQVGVTVSIRGAGSVTVVEGSLEDGAARSCVRDDNQNHYNTVSCPRLRDAEAFEAWVWLRATPSPVPAGDWIFEGWENCDATRFNAGHYECAVHSGAFSSDERYPLAKFRDTVAPTITGLDVQQVSGTDRQFRMSFVTGADARAECQVFGVSAWTQCWNGYVLTVPAGTYAIKVRSTDPSGNATLADRVVSSVDTEIVSGPDLLTSDSTADFHFSTVGGDAFWCSVDRGPYTSCGTGLHAYHTLPSLADGPHSLSVRASKGTWVDPVPTQWSWTIDTVVPTVSMTHQVNGASATFTFASSEPVAYQCKLDTPAGPGTWDWCTSPVSYAGLAEGDHELSVKARDDAFNRPAVMTHRWTVDTIAPTTALVPSASADSASFTFSAPDASLFECRLTTPSGVGQWAKCSSPTTYRGLVPGAHRFEARATDAAGNVETLPASHAWTATAPATTPTPGTPTPAPDTPTPTPGTPTPGAAKATSTTVATWKVSAARKGKVTVVVAAKSAPTGAIVVKDRGRVIARATLSVSHQGRIVVKLHRMRTGKHDLVVEYGGSATTAGSSSARRALTVR